MCRDSSAAKSVRQGVFNMNQGGRDDGIADLSPTRPGRACASMCDSAHTGTAPERQ